jgi:hypothetical protein
VRPRNPVDVADRVSAFERVRRWFLGRDATPEVAAHEIIRGLRWSCHQQGVRRGRCLVFSSADVRLLFAAQRYAPQRFAVGMDLADRAVHRAFIRLAS